jgi:hypothetical protein
MKSAVASRVPAPVAGEEGRQQSLDGLRRGPHAEHTRLSALERARSLAQRLGVRQQATAALEQILPLGRELNAAPPAIEQRNVQAGLEGLDLPRKRGLADIQPGGGPGEGAGVGDGDERAQVSEVHRH